MAFLIPYEDSQWHGVNTLIALELNSYLHHLLSLSLLSHYAPTTRRYPNMDKPTSSSSSSLSSSSSSLSPLSSFPLRPSQGMGLTLGPVVASNFSKRGYWVGYTQSTMLPHQLLGKTVAWAIEPAFHRWGLVEQFATGHQHLPQFWISVKWIAINLRAESLCARSPPRWGLQPWASTSSSSSSSTPSPSSSTFSSSFPLHPLYWI